jgi:6-phosphogluconolactonase
VTHPAPEVTAWPDATGLSRAVAHRLVHQLARLQAEGRVPSVVLTGGSIAERIHRAVRDVPEHGAVDWSRVEVWYGDERFVPANDPERNALQARQALLEHLPLDPARVHEMPASGGSCGEDVVAAARGYADELVRVLGPEPRFDVLMLGIGPDGHCASLFPGHEAVDADGLVVAVRDSPKPPPTRVSLTMRLLGSADEVWFVAAGGGKARAVRDAVTGRDVHEVPAAGPQGKHCTCFLLDEDAAAELPPETVERSR